MADDPAGGSALKRKLTRRNVLGGAAGAAVLAAAYSAYGRDLVASDGPDVAPVAGEAITTASLPSRALQSDDAKLTHLLRRTGFGVSREEFDRYRGIGLDATLQELLNYEAIDDSAAIDIANRAPLDDRPAAAPQWWLLRIANTKRPLQEKMTLFWHGLLTSQLSVVKDPRAMVDQNEFFRANALAPFPEILKGISKDRAMMVYLDIAGSRRQAPNENYARELMELFSLGEGNYTEQDVREAARAFTGWQVPRQRDPDKNRPTLGQPVFNARAHDDGSKSFLGRTGNFDGDDVVDIITQQPESARYITRRLFSSFVYPDPFDEDVQPFLDVYLSSGKSIGAVVEALLRSEIFYSPKAYRALVKSPIEYAIGAIKALGVQATATTRLVSERGAGRDGGVFGQMGQTPMEPPNVAGWPGGASWLNSATIFARLNLLNALTGSGASPDRPAAGAGSASLPPISTAGEALDHYLPFLVDNDIPDAARQGLLDFAGGADATLTSSGLRDFVYLMLAGPQFHLA